MLIREIIVLGTKRKQKLLHEFMLTYFVHFGSIHFEQNEPYSGLKWLIYFQLMATKMYE